jgi:hypothetical protein
VGNEIPEKHDNTAQNSSYKNACAHGQITGEKGKRRKAKTEEFLALLWGAPIDILDVGSVYQTYENISCDFYYRAGNSRVPELVREEGRADGGFFDSHDAWHVDHQEDHREVVDQEDKRRFS